MSAIHMPSFNKVGVFAKHSRNCSSIWSPYLTKDIDALEKVQMWATKFKGFGKLSYDQKLKPLGTYTLFRRHQHRDFIEVSRF